MLSRNASLSMAEPTASLDIFGIVTNGDTWQFYCLEPTRLVKESPPFAIGNLEIVLGFLRHLVEICDRQFD